jgi:hypothetical protein
MAENIDYVKIGREIVRGMQEAGLGSSFGNSFSPANPTASGGSDGVQEMSDKAAIAASRMEKFEKAVAGTQTGLTRAERAQIKRYRDLELEQRRAAATMQNARKISMQYQEGTEEGIKAQQRYLDTQRELEKATENLAHATNEFIDLQEKANDQQRRELFPTFGKFGTLLKKNAAALGMLAVSIGTVLTEALAKDVVQQLKAGSQLAALEMQGFSTVLGISTEEMLQLETANRQAINAMGGSSVVFGDLRSEIMSTIPNINGLARTVGGIDEAFKFVVNSTGDLAKAGISGDQAIGNFTAQMDEFRTIFGTSPEQFRELNNQLAQNVDIRQSLRGLDRDERRRRMESLRLQIQLNGAMGMTAEQAVAAATRLQELAGGSAKDRIGQAARLQTMAAAFGIQGGAEAASALRAGRRASPEQQRILQQVLDQLSQTGARLETGGSIGQEILFQQMAESLNLTDLVGKGSDFNSALTDASRVQQDANLTEMERRDILLKTNSEFSTLNNNAKKLSERAGAAAVAIDGLSNSLSEKFGQILRSSAGQIFGALGGAAILRGGLRGLPAAAGAAGAQGAGAAGAAAAGARGAGAAGRLAGAGSRLLGAGMGALRFAGPIGLAAGALYGGYNLYKDWDNIDSFGDGVKSFFGFGPDGDNLSDAASVPTFQPMFAGMEMMETNIPIITENLTNQTSLAEAGLAVMREQRDLLQQLVEIQRSLQTAGPTPTASVDTPPASGVYPLFA